MVYVRVHTTKRVKKSQQRCSRTFMHIHRRPPTPPPYMPVVVSKRVNHSGNSDGGRTTGVPICGNYSGDYCDTDDGRTTGVTIAVTTTVTIAVPPQR